MHSGPSLVTRLLRDTDGENEIRDVLADAVADVDYRPVWTAVLRYPFEIERPYYALVNTDEGLFCLGDWVAGEECLHAAFRNGLGVGEGVAYAL